jgi:hypothetical protein
MERSGVGGRDEMLMTSGATRCYDSSSRRRLWAVVAEDVVCLAQDARGGGGHGEGARRGGHEALGHLPRPRGQEERALLSALGTGRQGDEVSTPPSLPFPLIN